jgi:hypothetical protein
MYKLICWAVILLFQTSTPRVQRQGPQSWDNPAERLGNLALRVRPCVGQPKSLKELKTAFNSGRFPSPSEVTGTWAAIGFVYSQPYQKTNLDCAGVKRGAIFEWAILAKGYSVEIDANGTHNQTTKFAPDSKGSVTFRMDFEGDAMPIYRCRITDRGTLACLGLAYADGVEFKPIPLKEGERYRLKTGQ